MSQPQLVVWFDSMPESNGKRNWTVMLRRADVSSFGKTLIGSIGSGVCFYRGEYYDQGRYHADRLRYLIGEREKEPDILAYDPELKEPKP